MNRSRRIARLVWIVVIASAIGAAPSRAAKEFKEKPRKGQVGLLFVNQESQDAHGLVVMLSKKAIVVTDPETGFAGPFQNIRGVGTKTIELSHAHPVIAPATGDDEGLDLVFRSYKAGLKITGYYWTDAEGRRIGKKHSP